MWPESTNNSTHSCILCLCLLHSRKNVEFPLSTPDCIHCTSSRLTSGRFSCRRSRQSHRKQPLLICWPRGVSESHRRRTRAIFFPQVEFLSTSTGFLREVQRKNFDDHINQNQSLSKRGQLGQWFLDQVLDGHKNCPKSSPQGRIWRLVADSRRRLCAVRRGASTAMPTRFGSKSEAAALQSCLRM